LNRSATEGGGKNQNRKTSEKHQGGNDKSHRGGRQNFQSKMIFTLKKGARAN